MTGLIDLNPNHLATVERILVEYVPECEVRAFGSRATWTAKDYSDLDLIVVGAEPLDWRTFGRLKEAFEESSLPVRVDVLDWHDISESFRKVIERDCLVLQKGAKPPSGQWREITLGEVCTKIGSGATPRGGKEVYLGDGPYALIRSQNVYNAGFARDGLAFISDEHAEALQNVEVLPNDVLLNITGDSVARVCQVDATVLPARVNQHVAIVRPDPDQLDATYLRYYLASPEVQAMLLSWAGSGGTRNALTKKMIESFEVRAPIDLAEQRAIAHVLGTLDDKIELNRRMNETLEEMARSLFKSWFVDFEPVRAKMDGRWRRGESLPGLPAEHYDLFPDRLAPSELGEVPEGWAVKALGEVASQRRAGAKPEEIDADTPYIGLEHMPRHCITLSEWGSADVLASGKFRFKRRDILFGKLRSYFHKVGVAAVDGVCSTDIVVIHPINAHWFGFLLGHTSSEQFVNYTDATSTGTRMPRTKWTDMAQYKVALPSSDVAEAYNSVVNPWIEGILSAVHASRALAKQRDALLPGLVSGEVGVKHTRQVQKETNSA